MLTPLLHLSNGNIGEMNVCLGFTRGLSRKGPLGRLVTSLGGSAAKETTRATSLYSEDFPSSFGLFIVHYCCVQRSH